MEKNNSLYYLGGFSWVFEANCCSAANEIQNRYGTGFYK